MNSETTERRSAVRRAADWMRRNLLLLLFGTMIVLQGLTLIELRHKPNYYPSGCGSSFFNQCEIKFNYDYLAAEIGRQVRGR